MNVILCGYGRAGKIHYNNIIENQDLKLKYIYDTNLDIKNEFDGDIEFEITDNINVINDCTIDLVIICTPTNTHYNLVKTSLINKKHVLCEKPLAEKLDEINECYNIAEKNNVFLLCALNRRFDPQIRELNRRCKQKELGEIHQINTVSRDYPYPSANYLEVSSGIFHDCAVHDIDFVNWILDDLPNSVYVTGNIVKSEKHGRGHLDNAIIIMEYKDNVIVNINLSRISNRYDQRIEVYGDKGCLKSENNYKFYRKKRISFPDRYAISYKKELTYIVSLIKDSKKGVCKNEESDTVKIENNKTICSNDDLLVTRKDIISNLNIIHACEYSFKNKVKTEIKYTDNFRNYNIVSLLIKDNYRWARQHQTLDFVNKMKSKYLKFDKKMSIDFVFDKLKKFVDISDPDISLPNYHHGLQTAEGLRNDGYPEWLQLVGLIHDIGKIMYLWGCDEDGTSLAKQWSIVGDTFLLGCKIPDTIVFPEFNELNPDMSNAKYNTKNGIYCDSCGLDAITCSWGHDEYLYQVLKFNKCNLPDEALYIIRYHSLYTYHKHGEYKHFMNDYDKKMIKWLHIFNKYDLYTKSNKVIIDEEKNKYYDVLIKKYLNNGELFF